MMQRFLNILIPIFICLGISTLNGQDQWLASPESVAEFRKLVEGMRPNESKFEIQTEDINVDLGDRKIMIRRYGATSKGAKPALIYIHGACWVAGSLDSHDEICRYLALKGDLLVFGINYRLAPEHKFPAGHDDVYEVSKWINEHASDLGIEEGRIALSGESTGAYFSNATALRLADDDPDFKPLFQLLVYAAIDGGGSSWQPCKQNYFSSSTESRVRHASPLWQNDLSALPPTFNIYGEFEISRAEEELYIRKLADYKVPTKTYMHKGVGHDVGTWLSVTEESPAHIKAIEFIKEGFK